MSGSFFGDGFGLPDDPIARERAAFLSGNAGDLDAKLESLALNDNLGDKLDEDLDTFNDQTFDADVSEIAGKEFDFYKSTMENRNKVPAPPQQQQGGGAHFSQMLQNMGVNFQQAPSIPPPAAASAAAAAGEPRRGLTLAELEAKMIQQQQQQRATPIAGHQHRVAAQASVVSRKATADPEVIARRREERERRQAELERYNNMMSRHDKDYIIRIQISQLLTDDPAADDFYCHMYQLSRGAMFNPAASGASQSLAPQPNPPSRPSSSQPQRQQQQSQPPSNTSAAATPTSASTPAPAGTPTGQHVQYEGQGDMQSPTQGSTGARQPDAASPDHGFGDRQDQQQGAAGGNAGANPGSSGVNIHHQHQHHLTRNRRSNTQSSMARMQQQVQRIVNEARRRPKASHVAPEGALGKISVNSARNPKQVIQVQRGHAGSISHGSGLGVLGGDTKLHSPSPNDLGGIFAGLGDTRNPAAERRKTLRSIENVYGAVLRLEQLIREQVRLPPNPDHPSVQNWIAAYNEAKDTAWNELDASQPISNTYPHPLVRFLSFAKGKRIIPRLIHHLTIDQVLALTTTIIANFESLDVCRFGSSGYGTGSQVGARQREETDLFLHAVMPPALAFLAETSLQIVNGLFALFMERNNIAWVARTRPALAFLSMFLGRTEVLKQAGAHPFNAAGPVDKQEIYQASELYNHLFNSLRGSFLSIFPPSPALGQQPNPMEDIHAWQFLATLAVSASVEQQHTLVAEVREKVLEKVQLANSGRLPMDVASALTANVNLFLNALGLDASQVAM